MGLFDRKKKVEPVAAPPWAPRVDMATARPAVFALASAPASNDAQIRDAIYRFVRLGDRPTDSEMVGVFSQHPECLYRPWVWLSAVMEQANGAGDYHATLAALYWACYWSHTLGPRCDVHTQMQLELDRGIPEAQRLEFVFHGRAAREVLGPDFVVVGDETGQIVSGLLVDTAPQMLGLQ